MIDKLIERNNDSFKKKEEELNKLLAVETKTPEVYREGLYEKIDKTVDQLSLLHRRGGYYEFKKSNDNEQEHNT